jgi:hypothetical protein
MKSGDKVICVNAIKTKGYLQNGGIYKIASVENQFVRLVQPNELFLASRFQVLEQPELDNSLGKDFHSLEESLLTEARKDNQAG